MSRLTGIVLISLWLLPLAALSAGQAADLATQAAQKTQAPREVRLDSRVEAVQQATVSAQTGGQIEQLLFDVGDVVEKDALVVRLRDTEQRAQLARAEAARAEAEADLKRNRDNHRRISDLFAKQQVSTAERDQAQAALDAAEARLEQTQASLRQAQEQLDYTQVRAPYSGIVIQRHAELGEVAQPGKPLITGISLDRLRTLVAVPQTLVEQVRSRAKAEVELPDGSRVAASRITVFPIADANSNTFLVRVYLPEGVEGLFPGMFIKTIFQLGQTQWLSIPDQALAQRGEVSGVYVRDDDGRLSFRHLRIGRQLPKQRLAVLAGLEEGEQVVLEPIAAGVALKAQQGMSHGQ
ncbi:efflux RND transporter periplasmic adaptor subunit [Magnetovirga frankeli]|uniref:efflux RND transporter periplasmic adaptor subunit n=1 Tax=Magnetovirga frankeli TaxID=947516 RepID=UPI0012931ADF|nr:efflux RND transporter periplasmic adaptor subunit [gamma proteobacterium SS-5]